MATTPIAARLLMRHELKIAAANSTTDAPTKAAITTVLGSSANLDSIVSDSMDEAGVTASATGSGWLQSLLTWITTNLTSLLAAILALFGSLTPAPTPSPAG